MSRFMTCCAALVGLLLAASAPASATPPAPAEGIASSSRASVLFDIWFNQFGYSPTKNLTVGRHWYTLSADCDGGGSVAGQLYHSALGVDKKVGSVFLVPCGGSRNVTYNVQGGWYYFYFLSGVDNTRVIGEGA
ncbi:hypothetical protein [Streptomyces roseoviridis]|uniref:Uncharacterized protein n=1 Tax=Streptomyces roseoviridis TaxID=67361 RepID=A0ABV5QRP5_9ACTN